MIKKEQLSELLYFGSLYFISVGILYLWGYWSVFDINILEYMALSDIVKITIFPIVATFIFYAVGAVIGELLFGGVFPEGGGKETKIGILLNRYRKILFVIYLLGTILLLLYGPVNKWIVLPVFIAPPIYFASKQSGLFKELIPRERTRTVIIYLLIILPFFAFGHGKIKANIILEGTKYKYVTKDIFNAEDPLVRNIDGERLKYLGQSNQYIFFLSQDNASVLITTFDKIPGLKLKSYIQPKAVSQ